MYVLSHHIDGPNITHIRLLNIHIRRIRINRRYVLKTVFISMYYHVRKLTTITPKQWMYINIELEQVALANSVWCLFITVDVCVRTGIHGKVCLY